MRRGEGVEHSMAVHVYALGCDLDSTSAFSPCDDILKIISVLSQNYFFTGCIFLKKIFTTQNFRLPQSTTFIYHYNVVDIDVKYLKYGISVTL